MFIPIFIAILMGLVCPTNQSANKSTRTVYIKFDGPVTQNNTSQTDSIPPGGDGDGETGIGGDTGGETGNNPPRP